MEQRLYLHIGLPKCGSTALQAFFRRNISILHSSGIVYPDTTGRDNGNATAAALSLLGGLPAHFIRSNPQFVAKGATFDTLWAALISHALPQRSLLCSSEAFMRVPPPQLFSRARLDGYVPIVIVVLRRQDMMVEKSYLQLVRAGLARQSFDEYLEDILTQKNPLHAKLDYRDLLTELADCFGPENLKVIVYDEGADDVSIFRACLASMDVEWSEAFELPGRMNASISPLLAEYLRHWGIPQEYWGGFVKSVQKLLKTNSRYSVLPRRIATRPQIEDITGRFLGGNKWVAERFFPARSGVLFVGQEDDVNDVPVCDWHEAIAELHHAVMQAPWYQEYAPFLPKSLEGAPVSR